MYISQAIDKSIQFVKKIIFSCSSLYEFTKKIIFGDNSLDKIVAKTVFKEPNWSHVLNEESPNDSNSIE